MNQRKLLTRLVVLMFLLFAVNQFGSKFYWDSGIWWFDMAMHFFSGVWVGLFFIYVYLRNDSNFKPYLNIILYVVLVGVAWEIFEFFVNNVIGRIPFDPSDTISDTVFDILGGMTAVFYFNKSFLSAKLNKQS